ncbi:MAG: hypothetical protein IIC01_12435 [Planctomycetes bacterium]|nr:hypothetical protein [Planctomycetota bacterium]
MSWKLFIMVGCAAAFGFSIVVQAAIVATDGTVSTIVQELLNGQPGSVNSDRKVLDGDISRLPLISSTALTSTDLAGGVVSLGQAVVELADPARLDQPNPEELALEVACFSTAETVSYVVTGLARETRTILFSDSTTTPEIDFSLSSTREVESLVFLSGAVVIWSVEQRPDLSGMSAELYISISGGTDAAPLFETSLAFGGDLDNVDSPASNGPIRFERLGLDELINGGLDARSAEILRGVSQEGLLLIFMIPSQEHAYTYVVNANEPLTLTAEFETRVRNVPGGTGVAATLGRPFNGLAEFISRSLPGVDGSAVERSVNLAMASRAEGRPSRDAAREHVPAVAMCGTLGIVPLTLIGLGLLLMQLRFGRPAAASAIQYSRFMMDAGNGAERFSDAGERRDAAFSSGRG